MQGDLVARKLSVCLSVKRVDYTTEESTGDNIFSGMPSSHLAIVCVVGEVMSLYLVEGF